MGDVAEFDQLPKAFVDPNWFEAGFDGELFDGFRSLGKDPEDWFRALISGI